MSARFWARWTKPTNVVPTWTAPSFENRCLAVDEYGEDEACVVMLSDQATFCLSSGHALCPRYQAEQEAAATKEPPAPARQSVRPRAPPASPPIGCNRAWMNWTRIWMTATTRRSTGVCGAGSARCSSFSQSSSAAQRGRLRGLAGNVSSSLLPTPIDATGGLAAVPPVLTRSSRSCWSSR
ncbi:MAG: hypothetical protein R3A10_18900 [Caldilineaceae bacterium]